MTRLYRTRPAETWAKARDDYLAGSSAETVCRRYDLGLASFRLRARRYGWRRCDQVPPPPGEADLTLYSDIDLEAQIKTAGLRFIEALEGGKAVEARRWRRLWIELSETHVQIRELWTKEMTPMERVAYLVTPPEEEPETEEEARLLPMPPQDGPSPASE
ncbi:hypothetical protein GCM10017620_26440 [Brevundimonas intermedia]|uniref:Uncharacterized protein n=1 Tax=Brevundimonas intermedia TaxID=74315 RepID=A0ABQ5TAN0_9CAUL|nr:hypothetical protein [Brevundimonas intermedia]GLK49671.1 hypothetical protein GCM10017620_26440 [Brevundimonas intermedia]